MSTTFMPQGLYGPKNEYGGQVPLMGFRGGIASGYNTAIGIGDPVKMLTNGTFALAAPGDPISAVFAGWRPEDPSVYEQTYWKANTTYVKTPVVLYYPIAGVVYNIACVGSVAQSALGDAADIIAGTINVNSGRSGCYLDTANLAGAGAGAAKQFKIAGLRLEPGNDWGDAFTQVVVRANSINLGMIPGNAI